MTETPNQTLALLRAEYLRLHSECDAANDGALHRAYDSDVADRMVSAVTFDDGAYVGGYN